MLNPLVYILCRKHRFKVKKSLCKNGSLSKKEIHFILRDEIDVPFALIDLPFYSNCYVE